MNLFYLSLISSFSIALAAGIGLVRFTTIPKTYRPFILICILALVNELVSIVMIYSVFASNALNANIYVLAEGCLFVWQFRQWGSLRKKKWHIYLLIGSMVLIWVYENFFWSHITSINSLFRVYYSFCLIFLSVGQVNRLIVEAHGNLLKNARFLICMGVLIFYSYKAIMEVFYLLKIQFSDNFYSNIDFILLLVNLFVNLIYAVAVLWIPKKQKFMLPF